MALASAIHMTLASYYRHGRLDKFLKERQFKPLPMVAGGTVVPGNVRSPFVLCAGNDDAICNVTATV